MSHFFPMKRGDQGYLIAVFVFAFVAFLPWSHRIRFSGMALFGWLMAALMVLSPAIALIQFLLSRNRKTK